ncbi:unnamed protein product [Brachionus calyciflorus]|uniref:SWIM-type domain-containing protein n=1 Tax=Brachionus calyciflorus TaxID=104777 RepID=A0A814JIA4_9BILA|nr:unnamed protein product [Brachionus calyciflorus]
MLTDLSKSQYCFDLTIKHDNKLIKKADSLTFADFRFESENSAYRIHNNLPLYYVKYLPMFCSCCHFLDFGICKHYIAYCRITNKVFDYKMREFVAVKKRGRPKKSNNGALNRL